MKRALALAAVALLLGGCGGGSAVPVGSADEMPTLQVAEWGKVYRGGQLRIGAVNGRPLAGLDATQVFLSPGPQQIAFDILLCTGHDRQCQPIAAARIDFDAKPRRAYTARADEQGHGSNVFRIWVVDDTGAIVAPARP